LASVRIGCEANGVCFGHFCSFLTACRGHYSFTSLCLFVFVCFFLFFFFNFVCFRKVQKFSKRLQMYIPTTYFLQSFEFVFCFGRKKDLSTIILFRWACCTPKPLNQFCSNLCILYLLLGVKIFYNNILVFVSFRKTRVFLRKCDFFNLFFTIQAYAHFLHRPNIFELSINIDRHGRLLQCLSIFIM